MKLTFLPSPLSCVAGGLKHVGVFFSVKRKKSFKRENVCWFAECYFTNAGINKKKKKKVFSVYERTQFMFPDEKIPRHTAVCAVRRLLPAAGIDAL